MHSVKLLWSFLVCCGIAAIISLQAEAAAKRKAGTIKVAMVVGVQSYDRKDLELTNSRSDATELARTLESLGFRVSLVVDPSRSEFGRALNEYETMLEGSDVGLFFYAGHAFQRVGVGSTQASNMLLPRDFRIPEIGPERDAELSQRAIALEEILALLRSRAKVGIVFLDACRDNPFLLDDIAMADPGVKSVPAKRGLTLTRGLSPPDAGTTAAPTKKVSPSGKTTGMVIAYATEPGEVADDGNGAHSPFTQAILKNIKVPGRTLEQMLRAIATEVHTVTNGEQRPWIHSSLLGSDLLLVPREQGTSTSESKATGPVPAAKATAQPARIAAVPAQGYFPGNFLCRDGNTAHCRFRCEHGVRAACQRLNNASFHRGGMK